MSKLIPSIKSITISSEPGKAEGATLEAMHQKCELAMQEMVTLGLYAYGIKAQLPHGGFGPWLRKHAPSLARPKGVSWQPTTALSSYMQLTVSVLEAMGVTLTDWFPGLDAKLRKLGQIEADFKPYQLLLFPEAELNTVQKAHRDSITKLVAGHSKKAMIAKFVSVKEVADGDSQVLVPSTGAGVYHERRKDGSERMKKRTGPQKLQDEAQAKVPAWLMHFRAFVVPATKSQLELLTPGQLAQLKLAAYDAYNAILKAMEAQQS